MNGDYQKDYSMYRVLTDQPKEEQIPCIDHPVGFWVFSGFLTGCILALGMSLW